MTEPDNKRFVRESIERLWNDRRVDLVETYVASNFVDHSAPPDTAAGPAGFADGLRRILAAFPDARNDIDEIVAEGDRVAVRWTMSGTHTGDGLGFPPTNRAVRFSGVTITRLADGKAVEHWSYRDDLALLRQLGLMA